MPDLSTDDYIRMLEKVALDEGWERCEGCKRCFDTETMERTADDCWLCAGCASELRANGHVECPRHPGEDRTSCSCAKLRAVGPADPEQHGPTFVGTRGDETWTVATLEGRLREAAQFWVDIVDKTAVKERTVEWEAANRIVRDAREIETIRVFASKTHDELMMVMRDAGTLPSVILPTPARIVEEYETMYGATNGDDVRFGFDAGATFVVEWVKRRLAEPCICAGGSAGRVDITGSCPVHAAADPAARAEKPLDEEPAIEEIAAMLEAYAAVDERPNRFGRQGRTAMIAAAKLIRAFNSGSEATDARFGESPQHHRHDWVQYTLPSGAICASCSFCGHGIQLV